VIIGTGRVDTSGATGAAPTVFPVRRDRLPDVLYRTMELTLGPTLRTVFRPEVTGRQNIPPAGPLIFAANHESFADEFFIPITSRRQVFYFAKTEYFTAPGLRGRAMAAFFHGLGQVPVARTDTRSAAAVIDIGMEVLGEGRALGIFPEGTRSPDGTLYRFRTGAARLALRSGAPVVPVGLVGTRDVLPPDSRRWRRAPMGVHFGAPMEFGHLAEQERSARILREVTETIREAVQKLSGQKYVDSYASAIKIAE
jgi:1-acyl-sn-glycerol-3-phosphate acyltransferase